jgi:hypothetical protein
MLGYVIMDDDVPCQIVLGIGGVSSEFLSTGYSWRDGPSGDGQVL